MTPGRDLKSYGRGERNMAEDLEELVKKIKEYEINKNG